MPATSPGAKPTSWRCGTARASGRRTTWFAAELANLRTAFRWAADHGDLDVAATIATYAGLLGFGVENYEPVSWAEELIEPAVAVGHRTACESVCDRVTVLDGWENRRRDPLCRHRSDCFGRAPGTRRRYGVEGWLGAAYLTVGQPERWAELCRTQLERRRDNHVYIRACWVFALAFAGLADEAKAHTEGLIEAGVASRNPYMHSFAIGASSFPPSTTDTVRAMHACRKGLAIAQDSGNRFNESILAFNLARMEAKEAVTRLSRVS